MSFLMSDSLNSRFGSQSDAAAIYAEIEALPRGSAVVDSSDANSPIRKTRESFGPPVRPSPPAYIYGPALALAGLSVDGRPIVFDEASRNFLKLAAGEGYGSCPYLYAWRNEEQGWVRYGKVIDGAKDKTMTERVIFEGFPSRFRLAEEELEVAHIDHVTLEVELNDGSGFTLATSDRHLASLDGDAAVIPAGNLIDFAFALPDGVSSSEVKTSTLAITGYYQRYSDLQLSAR